MGTGSRTRQRASTRAPRRAPRMQERLLQWRATQISISNELIHVTPPMLRLEKRGAKAQTAESEVRNAAPLVEFHTELIPQKRRA